MVGKAAAWRAWCAACCWLVSLVANPGPRILLWLMLSNTFLELLDFGKIAGRFDWLIHDSENWWNQF